MKRKRSAISSTCRKNTSNSLKKKIEPQITSEITRFKTSAVTKMIDKNRTLVSRASNLRKLKKLSSHSRSKSRTCNMLYSKIRAAKTRKKFSSISSLSQISKIGRDRDRDFGKSIASTLSRNLKSTVSHSKKFGSKENINLDPKKTVSNFRNRRFQNYLKNLSNNRSTSKKDRSKSRSILHQSNFSNLRCQNSSAAYGRGSKSPKKSSLVNSQITNMERVLKDKKTLNFSSYYREISRKTRNNEEAKRYKEKYFEARKENFLLKKTLKKAISLISSSNMKSKVSGHRLIPLFSSVRSSKIFRDPPMMAQALTIRLILRSVRLLSAGKKMRKKCPKNFLKFP